LNVPWRLADGFVPYTGAMILTHLSGAFQSLQVSLPCPSMHMAYMQGKLGYLKKLAEVCIFCNLGHFCDLGHAIPKHEMLLHAPIII